jgi:hypothetical protein
VGRFRIARNRPVCIRDCRNIPAALVGTGDFSEIHLSQNRETTNYAQAWFALKSGTEVQRLENTYEILQGPLQIAIRRAHG